MPGTSVVPNCHRVLFPSETYAEIVVLRNERVNVGQQKVRLVASYAVDPLRESLVDEETLPSGDRVGANDWVDRLELRPVVQWRATNPRTERVAKATSLVMEERGVVSGGEAFEHLSHGGRQTIVRFIARRPHRVATGRRQSVNFEHGVVRRDSLKCDADREVILQLTWLVHMVIELTRNGIQRRRSATCRHGRG